MDTVTGQFAGVPTRAGQEYKSPAHISLDHKVYAWHSSSMKSKELIPILAEILGIPFSTAWVIDRSLANAGLRGKHKGPRPPDMTRLEALYFTVGGMISVDKPTKAGDEVRKWIGATGHLVRGFRRSDEDSDEEFEDENATIEITNHDMGLVLDGIPDLTSVQPLELFDVLIRATRWAADCNSEPNAFRFEIVQSHGYATMEFNDRDNLGSMMFQAESQGFEQIIASDYAINRSAHIFGGALAAIACRTEEENRLEFGATIPGVRLTNP